MQSTTEQQVFIVKQFYVTASPTKVKRAYVNQYRVNINIKTVYNLIKKWKDKGTILNQNKGHSGRQRSARLEKNITQINKRIKESSQNVRKLAAERGLKRFCKAYLDERPQIKILQITNVTAPTE